jgi:hypothetical protein
MQAKLETQGEHAMPAVVQRMHALIQHRWNGPLQ